MFKLWDSFPSQYSWSITAWNSWECFIVQAGKLQKWLDSSSGGTWTPLSAGSMFLPSLPAGGLIVLLSTTGPSLIVVKPSNNHEKELLSLWWNQKMFLVNAPGEQLWVKSCKKYYAPLDQCPPSISLRSLKCYFISTFSSVTLSNCVETVLGCKFNFSYALKRFLQRRPGPFKHFLF